MERKDRPRVLGIDGAGFLGSGLTIRSGVSAPWRNDEMSQAGVGEELSWFSTRQECRVDVDTPGSKVVEHEAREIGA